MTLMRFAVRSLRLGFQSLRALAQGEHPTADGSEAVLKRTERARTFTSAQSDNRRPVQKIPTLPTSSQPHERPTRRASMVPPLCPRFRIEAGRRHRGDPDHAGGRECGSQLGPCARKSSISQGAAGAERVGGAYPPRVGRIACWAACAVGTRPILAHFNPGRCAGGQGPPFKRRQAGAWGRSSGEPGREISSAT